MTNTRPAIKKAGLALHPSVLSSQRESVRLLAECVQFGVVITVQKQAERELRLTQFAVDRAGDGIFWVEKDARIVYANAQECRILGYGPEEILALRVHDIDPNFPAERWPTHWEELKQRQAFTLESHQRTKDGRLVPVEVTVNYLEAEGRECNCAIVRDITERKRIEESLRESEERFRTVVQSSHDAIVAVGAEGVVMLFNPAAARMFGYEGSELVGRVVDCLIPEEYRERHRRARESYFATSEPRTFVGRTVELPGLRRNGEVFPAELSLSEGCLGGKRFVLAIIRDISERKRAEEGLRHMQERVLELQRQEKAIVEAELNKARETLVRQTKLAAVGQLSGTIAHELRNPLAGIGYGVHLLRKYVPRDSKGTQYLGMIEGEVRTADEIITDCMAMSRGRLPSKEEISLSKVVAHARARVNAPDRIEWRYELESEPLMLHADAGQLEQVLRNLFSNAIQALGETGTITVEARHCGAYDEIQVGDNGPGIPQEVHDRVFEPLVTTKTRGTGLGLAICRQIIEQHGGTIELSATDRPGATFRIRLPAAEV